MKMERFALSMADTTAVKYESASIKKATRFAGAIRQQVLPSARTPFTVDPVAAMTHLDQKGPLLLLQGKATMESRKVARLPGNLKH
jgi:hypothetical protein